MQQLKNKAAEEDSFFKSLTVKIFTISATLTAIHYDQLIEGFVSRSKSYTNVSLRTITS